ncbi:ABC transporter substrate-binding protein [Oceanobacillus alkalisoli]|uniref:ABC transporter substrate-binding protein n=1 Tax=Oceanobacillus alkalisoli TaxID=2925113 RepID=UPI001EF065EB|nr:ABC transporter substrate-binding protein [Oceanobacillus alkalisoli]MCF3944638.1 ABC transporter substrate-binding protein [Oceanobacillus alkalisoli]MCG5104824.1 ABC transporter substrate-binding protein [Oceanobacillus alkalisoli]
MEKKWKYAWSFMLVLLIGLGIYSNYSDHDTADARKETITIADGGWDSMQLHNYIAAFIIEEGYGYPVDFINGSSIATFTGLRTGEIDVYMELWYVNMQEPYLEAIDAGEIIELSTNMVTDDQGFHVPTYVIEGDSELGIEPMAPDLKTVEDLKKYPELFQDPEDPTKGVIIGTQTGTVIHDILEEKVKTYGLDETFNYFTPGTAGAIGASLARAYMNHEPWVGYQWSPTWSMARYDMTLLEEPEYDEETFNENFGTKFPDNPAYITVHADFLEKAPDIAEMLSNYETSTEIAGDALLYMEENDATPQEAALWFLENYEEVWTEWIPEDIAARVKQAL